MLKHVYIACCLGLLAVCLSAAAESGDEIAIGDSIGRVHEVLGPPGGYMRWEETEVLIYERGKVDLQDGVVTGLHLVSEEQARLRTTERQRRHRERLAAEKARREELRLQGFEIKQRLADDPLFASLSAAEQVAYWRRFRVRYPDVDVSAEYADALARRADELENEQLQQRVADLERRVADAEARVANAERNRYSGGTVFYTSAYRYPSYSGYRRTVCRPPTVRPPLARPPVIRPCVTPSRTGVVSLPAYSWRRGYFGTGGNNLSIFSGFSSVGKFGYGIGL